MRRPGLFNLAAALSLLLCLGTLALWARSYDVTDRFYHGNGRAESGLVSQWGELALYRRRPPAPGDPPRPWSHAVGPPRPMPYNPTALTPPPIRAPVRLYNSHSPTGAPVQALILAHWLLVAAAAPLPLAWLLARRRARRRRARAARGLCPACGYDLRASPDRCPECGAATG